MNDGLTCVLMVIMIAALLVLASGAEGAEGDNSIMYLCCSHHPSGAANQDHLGVFYARELGDGWNAVVGTYQNSGDQRSLLAGAGWQVELSESWDLFVVGGLVTGYERGWLGAVPGLEYRDRVQLYIVPGVVYGIGFTVVRW